MKFHLKTRSRFIGTFLLFLTIFTRFFKLDWGNGYYFHPDENNMANSVLQMSQDNLNPHFFAYGQFPLFLTFFTTPVHQFDNIIFTLRFWSAIFSGFSVLFFYLIAKEIFKHQKTTAFATLLFIFTPGLIQFSHFGTTESILIFVFLVNIFLSLKILDKFKFKYLVFASLVSAIGLATKISAFIFLIPIFLSLFLNFFKDKNFIKFFLQSLLFFSFTILIFIIFSPFNLIDFSSFLSTMKYEVGVANGQILVFYTRQFLNTLPYIFQFQKIFPYTNGLPILFFSLIGIFCLPKKSKKFLLIIIPSLIFFLYQGQLFVKWTRFMAPIFFIFPLLATCFLLKIKNNFLKTILIIFAVLPGIYFLRIYSNTDIRLQASNWINQNIVPNSQILSESGNIINLPLDGNYQATNFDFYNLDQDFSQKLKLNALVRNSDYIIVPSRRVFKNQNNSLFPYSQEYYQNLFSGSFGFFPIKEFSQKNSLFLNSENAEETWSVFDNPTIRIFKKINNEV